MSLRPATPNDYDALAAVVDQWWGRPLLGSLPRLFLDHFHRTSLIAEAVPSADLQGFLVGFHSPADPTLAYIHFVAVSPAVRGSGLGRRLYEAFFAAALADGRTEVHAITAAVNDRSIRFHRALGFSVQGPGRRLQRPRHVHVHLHPPAFPALTRTPHPAPRTRTPHPAPPAPAPRTPHPAPRTPHPAPRDDRCHGRWREPDARMAKTNHRLRHRS